jgi:hypothetical protein
MTPRRRARRALSLVEIVLVFAIVTTLVVVLLQAYAGTQKQSVRSESRFHATMLAQMVIERLRSTLAMNPAYFRFAGAGGASAGPLVIEGTVVDRAVLSPAGGATALSPLLEHLFVRSSPDLYAPANRVSLSLAPADPAAATNLAGTAAPDRGQIQGLVDAFRDFHVAMRIEDDVDLEPAPDGSPTPLKESVKKVTVTVSRLSARDASGRDPGAVRVATRIVVPQESLSDPALDALLTNFEGSGLEAAWEEFFLSLGDNPYFSEQYLTLESKRLLADCYIILGTVNTEAFLTDGTLDGRTLAGALVFTTSQPSQPLNGWVALLSRPEYYRVSVIKRAVARLIATRVKVQFDAFRKIQPVLQHLAGKHDDMLPQIDRIIAALTAARQQMLTLDSGILDGMKRYRENESKGNEATRKLEEAKRDAAAEAAAYDRDIARLLQEAERYEQDAQRLASSGASSEDVSKKREEASKKRREADKKRREKDEKAQESAGEQQELERKVAAAQQAQAAALGGIQASMSSFAGVVAAQGANLVDILELVTRCKFIHDFFQASTYRAVIDRLEKYPVWFRTGMEQMERALVDHLAQADGPTPHDQVMTAQQLVEVTKIRQLEQDSADPAALARLTALGEQYRPRISELSRYLTRSEVHDFQALRSRNARFASRIEVMRNLGDPSNSANLYRRVVKLYESGGKIDEFIRIYTQVAQEVRLDSGSVLAQLGRQLTDASGRLTSLASTTQQDILNAMRRLGR